MPSFHTEISAAKLGALCLASVLTIALAGCQNSANDYDSGAAPGASSTAPMSTSTPPPAAPQSSAGASHPMGALSGSMNGSFAMQAATNGLQQVVLANLALDKSSNADIKSFAQTIQTDRSAANDTLKSIASKDVVTMPTDMTAEQKTAITELKAKNGAAFDKAYVDTMARSLGNAIRQFEDGSKTASTHDLRQFAASMLPQISEQLKTAQSLQARMAAAGDPSVGGSTQ